MLKPITEDEKLKFTINILVEKAVNELLYELFYDKKYDGIIDIEPFIKKTKNGIKVSLKSEMIVGSKPLNQNKIRYMLVQGKGIKTISK